MMYGWHSGMGGGMVLWWLIFLVFIGLGLWFLVRARKGRDRTVEVKGPTDAESILDQRFAKGEIDEDDYQKRRKALRG